MQQFNWKDIILNLILFDKDLQLIKILLEIYIHRKKNLLADIKDVT